MIKFSEVERSVRELKNLAHAGQIDQKTLEARLMEMVDVAEDGHYWMFGHKTERWYRHDGRQWVPAAPEEIRANSKRNGLNQADSPNPHQIADWASIEWGWFIASLAIIGAIAWMVFTSSLPL